MAYCVKCGTQIAENAKFCQKCGHPTGVNGDQTTRNQEFVGKLYKCPNCGEVLKSFEINCPSCGYELRGIKASSAVKEFALKLEAIEQGVNMRNLEEYFLRQKLYNEYQKRTNRKSA